MSKQIKHYHDESNSFRFDPLSNDKFLDMTKLKAFADDKLNFAKITISLCDRVENTVGKEENAGYKHFLLFSQCFPSSFEVGIVWQRVKTS